MITFLLKIVLLGHGPQTGKCVSSDRQQYRWPELKNQSGFTPSASYSQKVCEVQTWCPVEDDRSQLF